MTQIKRAIVVGASSGIGKGVATLLANENYLVGITGRRENHLQEIKNTNPHQFFVKTFDVQDIDVSIQKIDELIEEMGGLDLLVYSSGIGVENKSLDFNIELDTIKTNTIGFTNIATHVFKYFTARKSGQLAVITSIAAYRGNPDFPAYFATKAYLMNYTECLRIKSKQEKLGITVTDLRPGFVKTGHVDPKKMFWSLEVPQASRLIVKGIDRKKEVVYITKRWWIIAFIMKMVPRFIYDRLPF